MRLLAPAADRIHLVGFDKLVQTPAELILVPVLPATEFSVSAADAPQRFSAKLAGSATHAGLIIGKS